MEKNSKAQTNVSGIAVALALLSSVAWVIPIVGIPISIMGLVLGDRSYSTNRGRSLIAILLCVFTLLLAVFNAYIGFRNTQLG